MFGYAFWKSATTFVSESNSAPDDAQPDRTTLPDGPTAVRCVRAWAAAVKHTAAKARTTNDEMTLLRMEPPPTLNVEPVSGCLRPRDYAVFTAGVKPAAT